MTKKNKNLRIESKFKISILELYIFKDWLQNNVFFNKSYNDRRVNTLYFDTQDYLSAYENMSGQSNRFKLRARWYCKDFSEYNEKFVDNKTFFRIELKKKKNLVCDKILLDKFKSKYDMNFNDKLDFLKKRVLLNSSSSSFLRNFNFNPIIFVSYFREYYQLFKDRDVRITVDHDIRYSSVNHNVFHLASDNFFLVELKFPLEKNSHVNQLFSTFPFRKTRLSKYLITLANLKSLNY